MCFVTGEFKYDARQYWTTEQDSLWFMALVYAAMIDQLPLGNFLFVDFFFDFSKPCG